MASDTLTHDHDLAHAQDGGSWKGGSEPFKASYGKLMM